ncbi:MAG TPA: hypothetical protein VNI52_09255 [Sphingobacteriaceae bacterium]|nr:hypothetical protein [Sphingobacteriaceae bacterium]
MIKKAIKTTLGLILVIGSSGYAQSTNDALKAIDAEQYQKAKTILKGLTNSQASNAENYFHLGNVYLKQGYTDSAKMTFNKGISANVAYPLNHIGLGSVELDGKNAMGAQPYYDKALATLKKKDYLPLLYIGRSLIDAPKPLKGISPDYQKAITYLEKAKALNPKDANIYLALGDAYRGQMKNSEAFSAYRSAFDLDKSLLRSKVALGIINKESKAWPESVVEFNNVLAIDANYAPAYRELAETNLQWGFGNLKERDAKIKQALEHYKKYISLTDKSIESRMRYADFLVYANDWKTLQQEAEAMVQLDKTNPRIYRYLGYASYENGNYPASLQAIKDFMAKVDSKRLLGSDYLYLGKAQLKTGATAEGFTNIKKAIEMDSTSIEVMSEVAKAFYTEKQYPDAQMAYEIAIKNPESKTLLNDHVNLGLSYYYDYAAKIKANEKPGKEFLTKADSSFSYVIQKSPAADVAYILRARVKRLADDQVNPQGLSVSDYEKFIELTTAKGGVMSAGTKGMMVEAYNNVGAFYVKTNLPKAKEYLTKAAELDPANTYSRDVLKQIGGSK